MAYWVAQPLVQRHSSLILRVQKPPESDAPHRKFFGTCWPDGQGRVWSLPDVLAPAGVTVTRMPIDAFSPLRIKLFARSPHCARL